MLTTSPAGWPVRGATFALWLLAAASAGYWMLELGGSAATGSAAGLPARSAPAADPAAIARLLGGAAPLPGAPVIAAAAAPDLASRFQLVGVVAEGRSGRGAAVIAVDGKPARPYRVGTALDEGVILQSVQQRSAVLARDPSGPPLLLLELPPVQRAAPNSAPVAAPFQRPPAIGPAQQPVPNRAAAAGGPDAASNPPFP